METKENALSAFGEETLNEMAMESLEGGILDNNKVNKCTNNCDGGNCAAGCGAKEVE